MTDPRPRVLYIDDDDGLRLLVKRGLVRHGFEIELAASGVEGVEKARDGAFDIIAVDHYMPGQDGLATLEMLRALPSRPPIIYVTGSEESRIAVAALKAGAADYVVKTIGEDFFDLLASACHQALDQGPPDGGARAGRGGVARQQRPTGGLVARGQSPRRQQPTARIRLRADAIERIEER